MAISWRLDARSLNNFSAGIFAGIVGLGAYWMLRIGPWATIGVPGWTPHAYNFVIWGSFALLVVYRRFGTLSFPALFMIYGVDEIIWTSTFVLTTCGRQFTNLTFENFSSQFTLADGYFFMVILIAVISWSIVRPKIVFRPVSVALFVAWWAAYTFVFHVPIIANECLPAQIPGNITWEIAWQFSYLAAAYRIYFARPRSPRSLDDGREPGDAEISRYPRGSGP